MKRLNLVWLILLVGNLVTSSADAKQNHLSTSFSIENNALVERSSAEGFQIFYEKAALPEACNQVVLSEFEEQFTQQPSQQLIGSWKDRISDSYGGFYLRIHKTGQIDSFMNFETDCHGDILGELNGNTLLTGVAHLNSL